MEIHIPGASVMRIEFKQSSRLKQNRQFIRLYYDAECTQPVFASWNIGQITATRVSLTGDCSGNQLDEVSSAWPTSIHPIFIPRNTVYLEYECVRRNIDADDAKAEKARRIAQEATSAGRKSRVRKSTTHVRGRNTSHVSLDPMEWDEGFQMDVFATVPLSSQEETEARMTCQETEMRIDLKLRNPRTGGCYKRNK